MAELLVRTEDKPASGNPLTDRHRSGRGCVITIQPDGHPWSEAERTAPFWRIVRLPGVPRSDLTQFTAPDVGYGDKEAEAIDRVLRRWASALDLDALDALSPTERARIAAGGSSARDLLLAMRKARPALQGPVRIIGPPQSRVRIIG